MTVVGAPAPFRIAFDSARDPYTARNALGITDAGFITSVTAPLSVTGGNLAIDTSSFLTSAAVAFNCGRLTYVSATALSFAPYNGDRIKIAGVIYAIPSGGIAGLTNGGLSASTTYFVYAYNNAGTITGEFSTTTHATNSTDGVRIKSGDSTRTLIGMVRTNASSQFVDTAANRWVISWFNRRNIGVAGISTAGQTTASATPIELNTGCRAFFLTWSDEAVVFALTGSLNANVLSTPVNYLYLDSSSAIFVAVPQGTVGGAGYWLPTSGTHYASLAVEGAHWITPYGSTNAGTATYHVYVTAMIRG